jgi:predicted CoA-binding protein
MLKKTLVLGASLKPSRYSNMAIHRLTEHGHPVVAVGLREGEVDGVHIGKQLPSGEKIHTVTMYLNEGNQRAWEQQVLDLKPERIIFNPGAENPRLEEQASRQGIEVLEACTLVMLATGQY